MRTVSIGGAANPLAPASACGCPCAKASVSRVAMAPAAIAVPPSFKKSLLSIAPSYSDLGFSGSQVLRFSGSPTCDLRCQSSDCGGRINATIDEYHSPWLCTYEPRIHNSAVRGSSHFGMTGLRLSYVELRVIGVHVHFPSAPRRPRNNS